MSSPIRPPLWITETDGNPSGRPVNKIVVSNGTLTINGTTAEITTGGSGGSGTVTNVSSTDSFISITNPNTTPSITIQDATTSQDGILTSTDWNNFNNKTSNSGTVTSVGSSQSFVSVASATTTPSISIGSASGSATGVLLAADWTTFNNKGSGDGTIGGSIANTQVAVGSAADTISGSNSLLFDGTSLTVNTGGNDPTLNLTNNTKSVTLKVATSQKLTIQGSSDTFVFDASSSTGGITFPDSTLQTTAATGTVTNVQGALPIVSSGGTSPSISINQSTTSADGYLSATDWNTFNGKSSQTLTLSTTGTSGVATLIGSTLNIPNYATGGGGGITWSTPVDSAITLDANGTYDLGGLAAGGKAFATIFGKKIMVGDGGGSGVVTTQGSNGIIITTNNGSSTGYVLINAGANNDIEITPNGTGNVSLGNYKFKTDQTVGAGQDNYVLTYDNASSSISLEAAGGGGVTFPLEGSDGTAAAPTYSFASDDNNGMYLSASDTLSLSSGGLEKLRLDGTGVSIKNGGRFGLETGQVSNPAIRWNDATNMGFYKDGSTAVSFTSGGVRQMTFDSSGRLRLGNGSASNLTTYGTNLVLDTDVGVTSGSIVIEQGANGQISISPNGSGTIKLDGVTIDNSAIATGKILKATSATAAGWATEGGGGVTFPLEAPNGSSGVPSYAFSSDTDTGLYLLVASNLGIAAGGFTYMSIGSLGSVQFDKKALFNSATANAPNGFATDTNTGFFGPAADTFGISTAGTERIRIGSSGEIIIGGTAAGTAGQVLTSGGSGAAPTWAAAGGGGAAFAPVAWDSTGYAIMGAAPYGNASYGTGSIQNTSIFYHPFIAPRDMTVNTTYLYITTASSGGAKADVAIYSNKESTSEPETLLCKISIGTGSTGYNSSSSWTSTSTLNLTGGTTYWMAHTGASGSADSFSFQSVASSARAAVAKSVGNASQNCLVDAASGAAGFPTTPNVSQFNRSPMCIFIEAL